MTEPALFEVDDTLTVGQLTRQLGQLVKAQFRDEVWVQGQIRNLSRSARGHVYFNLIEPVAAGATPKASISVTLFDSNRQVVNRIITRTGNSVRIDDGVEVRIRAAVEFYAPRGQLQLNMTSIDPEFTLGRLGADRDQLLAALKAEDLLDANEQRGLALVPLRIALITGEASAAEADFVNQIEGSGYRFAVSPLAARVQGEFAAEEIAAAIAAASPADFDVIALVRGGGARTDLAAFDSELVARAIAGSLLPVVCGIGHEIDSSVADLVAHSTLKTPTACAQFLIERVVGFDFGLADRARRLREVALILPALARARVDACAHATDERTKASLTDAASRNSAAATLIERLVQRRIARSSDRLSDARARLVAGTDAALRRSSARCAHQSSTLVAAVPRIVRSHEQDLMVREAHAAAADPAQALRRGFTITRNADGTIVRSIADAALGSKIVTHVSDGSVESTVDATRPTSSPQDQT